MNLKKLLINSLFRKKFSKKIRNFFNFKPTFDLVDYTSKNLTVSDAFFWRTDNGFKTTFKFTNLINFFYKNNEKDLSVIFFDKDNKFIKEEKFNNNVGGQFLIDSELLNNIQSYGVFYVFHNSNDYLNGIIRNSCYTGFSINNSLPSYIHGNTVSAEKKIDSLKINYGIGGYSNIKKKIYIVQNYYKNEKTEIMINNPTKKNLLISVNELKFKIRRGCTKILNIEKDKLIKIKSNCNLLRPIVFTYDKSFFDVHHG